MKLWFSGCKNSLVVDIRLACWQACSMLIHIKNSKRRTSFKIVGTAGVYFLKSGGVIVYIGKSINIFSRIFSPDHCGKKFDEVEIHWMDASKIKGYERSQIMLHRPKFNDIEHMTKRKDWLTAQQSRFSTLTKQAACL